VLICCIIDLEKNTVCFLTVTNMIIKNTEIVRHTIYMRYKLLKVLFRVLECSVS